MSAVAAIKAEPSVEAPKAEETLRKKYLQAITHHIGEAKLNSMKDMLDICCGIGNSTFSLAENFPQAS
jgi:trans-aconitate methyltransferase